MTDPNPYASPDPRFGGSSTGGYSGDPYFGGAPAQPPYQAAPPPYQAAPPPYQAAPPPYQAAPPAYQQYPPPAAYQQYPQSAQPYGGYPAAGPAHVFRGNQGLGIALLILGGVYVLGLLLHAITAPAAIHAYDAAMAQGRDPRTVVTAHDAIGILYLVVLPLWIVGSLWTQRALPQRGRADSGQHAPLGGLVLARLDRPDRVVLVPEADRRRLLAHDRLPAPADLRRTGVGAPASGGASGSRSSW